MIQAAWERNWNELIEFFNYPMDIRKAIYTTNAIESLNFSLRKITRNKSSFPDDDSIYKVMYLAIRNASKRWTMPIRNWALAVNQASHTIWQTGSNLLIRTYPFTQFSWQAHKIIAETSHTLIFLPPYSPDLNPIEHYWSALKRNLASNMHLYPSVTDALNSLINVN